MVRSKPLTRYTPDSSFAPVGRAAARKAGSPVFHGTKCKLGHGTLKRTQNGVCVVCHKAYNKQYRKMRRGQLVMVEEPPISEEERIRCLEATYTGRRPR